MFLATGYGIPSTKSKEDVMSLFAVLAGEESIETAAKILNNKELVKYAAEHGQESWTPLKHRKQWWTRSRHLGKSVM